MKNTNKKSGFTLVELAIVLVIIGLIVGGVLAGQDLIKAAELRAAVGQIEKMDTAVNAFRGKYNGIPGDIQSPANFGFTTSGLSTTLLGNGVLDATTTAATAYNSEPAAFMAQLASAGLITETINPTDFGSPTGLQNYAALSKLGRGIYLFAQANAGTNYYMVDNKTLTTGTLSAGHTVLSPINSFNMDSKLDDGVPSTGKVRAALDVAGTVDATFAAAAHSDTSCYSTVTTPPTYTVNTAERQDQGTCSLRIKASF